MVTHIKDIGRALIFVAAISLANGIFAQIDAAEIPAQISIEQTASEVDFVLRMIETAEKMIVIFFRILNDYGFKVAAVIGAPYLMWRWIQSHKLQIKKRKGEKPHWAILDTVNIVGTFTLSLAFHAGDIILHGGKLSAAVASSFAVACFGWLTVKLIFKFAPRKVVEVMQDGVYIDDDANMTRMAIATVIAGRRGDERKKARPKNSDSDDQTVRNT